MQGEENTLKTLISQTEEKRSYNHEKRIGYYKCIIFWDKREHLEVKNAVTERKKIRAGIEMKVQKSLKK